MIACRLCLCRSPSAEMRHAVKEFVRQDRSRRFEKSWLQRWAHLDGACWCYVCHVCTFARSCAESSSPKFTRLTHTTSISSQNVVSFIHHNSYGICGVIAVLCHFNKCPALTFIFNSSPILPKYSAISEDISSSLKCGLMAMAAKSQSYRLRSPYPRPTPFIMSTMKSDGVGNFGAGKTEGISFGASLTPFLNLPIVFSPDPFGYLSALSRSRTR